MREGLQGRARVNCCRRDLLQERRIIRRFNSIWERRVATALPAAWQIAWDKWVWDNAECSQRYVETNRHPAHRQEKIPTNDVMLWCGENGRGHGLSFAVRLGDWCRPIKATCSKRN